MGALGDLTAVLGIDMFAIVVTVNLKLEMLKRMELRSNEALVFEGE